MCTCIRVYLSKNYLINIRLDAILFAVDDLPVEALFGGHVGGGIGEGGFGARRDVFVVFDVALKRVGAAVEDEVFGEVFFFLRNVGVGSDVGGIHNRHVQASLHAVIEHDRVQHRAGMLGKAEGQVAHAERSHHARQVLFDEPNPFNGFDGGFDKLLVACGEGEG
ncbi:MAG: hypothetical protein PGMFKBFP_02722 [Anaerolineales bacterium]|nr:hypothetical protein [Anaerolineales bacterium]